MNNQSAVSAECAHGACSACCFEDCACKCHLLEAARCAANVLYLLEDEVKRLGFRAKNVPAKLRDAIARCEQL